MISRINITDIIGNAVNEALLKVTEGTKTAWANEASKRLNTTYPAYARGISSRIKLGTSPSAEVYLKGSWANKLESGFPAYDMKPKLQASKKVKTSIEDTWYLTIPMSHTTSSASGRMGKVMPRKVYDAARSLPSWGKLSSNSPSVPKGGWGHYEGLTKIPTNNSNTKHSYKTFRTVGENSPDHAFMHPGFEGVHIADDLREQIPDTFKKVLEGNLAYLK